MLEITWKLSLFFLFPPLQGTMLFNITVNISLVKKGECEERVVDKNV